MSGIIARAAYAAVRRTMLRAASANDPRPDDVARHWVEALRLLTVSAEGAFPGSFHDARCALKSAAIEMRLAGLDAADACDCSACEKDLTGTAERVVFHAMAIWTVAA